MVPPKASSESQWREKWGEIQTQMGIIIIVYGVKLKILTSPRFLCSRAMKDQKIETSLYSFCCIHAHGCIHNQVYSLAPLWFPALELSFINSCTVIPAHS